MSEPLTSTLLAFDRKTKKFKPVADLFNVNLKMYPHLREVERVNYFHSLMPGDATNFCEEENQRNGNNIPTQILE